MRSPPKIIRLKFTGLIMFFLVVLGAGLPAASIAHPIHVSVCEINHDTEDGLVEITMKIFADDFGDVLKESTGEDIRLGSDEEHPRADALIMDYLREKFLLDINGSRVELQYSSRKIEDVAIWCHLFVPNINTIESLTVQDDIMLHWFKDQVNVVHLDCNDKLNSTFFSGKTSSKNLLLLMQRME